ncbi:hypothetical protein [Oligoflexus tunisiensis]|uniref:hypothetical protein n=1 Tax=Oligoflexus tunisiensis TaxID=708132 RepID=UPI00114CDE4B|nr:hypothetical protein [Oligoflexus tunisiensis]
MDIIDRAYADGKPHHWDELSNWLKIHAKNVNNVDDIMEASAEALRDGRIFPDNPDEARLILKKYHRLIEPNH